MRVALTLRKDMIHFIVLLFRQSGTVTLAMALENGSKTQSKASVLTLVLDVNRPLAVGN